MIEAGIHLNMTAAEYFKDPCPQPSLTQSVAKILLDRSPLHAWHAHPRLNPDWRPDDPTKFDVGNVAHKLMIGRGKDIAVLDKFDDWRKDAAKDARAEAQAAGKLAVLGKTAAKADRMVRAAREQLDGRGLGELFQPGHGDGEAVMAWEDRGMWLRQMVDWLTTSRDLFVDFKTTDMSVAPFGLGRMMVNAGWPIQAAMGEWGLNKLVGFKRRRFLFVAQETEHPYCLSVVEMSEAAMTMGRKQLNAAFSVWMRCVAADRWPGYPTEIVVPEYPGFAESSWLEREVIEFSDVPILMAG